MRRFLVGHSWQVLLLLLAWSNCYAEIYSATVPIVEGDVARARQEAIKEMLWEAGLQGGVAVESKTAVIQDLVAQSTIVSSRIRLKEFALVSEEILADRISISARIEKQSEGPSKCASTLPFKNIKFAWNSKASYVDGPNQYPGAQLFGDLLAKTLHEDVGDFLAVGEGNDENLAYRLTGSLVTVQGPDPKEENVAYRLVRALISIVHQAKKPAGEQHVRFQLTGANGKTIRVLSFPVGSTGLAVNITEDRGYTKVSRWIPTSEAIALVKDVAATLAKEIRCLPALVRISDVAPDGAVLFSAEAASLLKQRPIVFFAETWPLGRDGELDPVLLEGQLQSAGKKAHWLQLKSQSLSPDRKTPTVGGYLVFL